MSLPCFSHVSGITFLGMPAEIYSYGSQLYASLITNFIIMFLVNYLYLPVFFELQLNSVYEVCTGSDKTNIALDNPIHYEGCMTWIYFWSYLFSRKL